MTMVPKAIAALYMIFFFAAGAKSQEMVGSWSDHLSYNNCIAVTTSTNYTIGLTASGIIKVNNSTFETTKINKVNLLSDVDASAILAIGTDDSFILGYTNGNIDIYKNRKLTNMPDIKEKSISGSKTINRFRAIGNWIMAMTDFGVVVIDPIKFEVRDTWYLGKDNSSVICNDITLYEGFYYIASENGLYKADASNTFLSHYEAWTKISEGSAPYKAVQVFQNKLVTVHQQSNLFYSSVHSNQAWQSFSTVTNYKDLYVANKTLHVVSTGSIDSYSENLVLIASKNKYVFDTGKEQQPTFSSVAVSPVDGSLWFSDHTLGLLQHDASTFDKIFTPKGPSTNIVQDLIHNGNYLVAVPGIQTTFLNNAFYPATINFFDGDWTYLDGSTDSLLANQYDLFNITTDPYNSNHFYIASWANGVFEVKDKEIVARFNSDNSPLKTIIQGNPNYIRVGAAVPTKNGDLFISNSYVGAGMIALSSNAQTVYTYKTLETGWMGDMVIDNNGYVWTYTRTSSIKNGLFVFDTNNTVHNQLDDRYKGALNKTQDIDSRNAGEMAIIDQDGNAVTSEVYSLAIDKNGYIWVGTDKGPLVNYRPWAVFDESHPIFNRIKIPRNDGENSADYLLDSEVITCITVDGANRKWLGTRSSGAFLVSEDGTQTIYNFNTTNSPIISDNILSIAIDPKSGNVYFGTDKGIVSFKGTATEGDQSYSNVYAYPNPVRPGYTGSITIKGLIANSNVKIASVSGALVYETTSLGGQVVWNGKNMWGQSVTSGVYIVYMVDEYGQESAATKILIVR
jgi:hypothetical protein